MTVPPDIPILTTQMMRDAEAAAVAAGTSLTILMERAGAAVADVAWRMAAGAPILILCGPGNNGGDGYVAARLLAARGAVVRVAAAGDPRTELSRAAKQTWGGTVETLSTATGAAPVIVDALFGVGLTRKLDDDLTAALARMAGHSPRVIAVDLPSGVDSDSGHLWSTPLRAAVTVALGALKPAHVLLPSSDWCGRVICADIGVAADRFMATLPFGPEPARGCTGNKFTSGMVMVRAGAMAGAAGLAAVAAYRAGAGYVLLNNAAAAPRLAIISEPDDRFAVRLADRRLGAVVIGPGSLAGAALDADVARILDSRPPTVFDAAAIDCAVPILTDRITEASTAILTPHSGEFDRAFPHLCGNKIDRTRAAAVQTGAVVIHKGADTIIAAPDGRIIAAWPGSPWLATAGTGDILAGACGAMLARGMDGFAAAVQACSWHIAAARRIGAGLIADDLLERPIL